MFYAIIRKINIIFVSDCEMNQLMNTLEAILTRRSCREFTEQPIEGEKLHQLLEAAMSGPSCVNAQD